MTLNLCDKTVANVLNENCWEKRKDVCIDMLLKYQPTILCTQEGVGAQLDCIKSSLNGYEYFGMSRDGLPDSSEPACAILFNQQKVDRFDGGTFWLSKSPCTPGSKSWGAKVPSFATWATFHMRGLTPPGFAFQVNVELDSWSRKGQQNAAFLLWRHISSLPPNLPVILCGNFSTFKDTRTGGVLLGKSLINGMAGDMKDAWANAHRRKNANIVYTAHDFRGEDRKFHEFFKSAFLFWVLCGDPIVRDLHKDWIFFRSRFLSPSYSELITWAGSDGQFPSSHYPVYVNFSLPRSVRLAET